MRLALLYPFSGLRCAWRGAAALPTLGRVLLHILGVFLARHWVLAVANAGLTALLGLGVLRLVRRLSLVPSLDDRYQRLRYFVFLAALCKGAFYLVLGDNHHFRSGRTFGCGFQLPSPLDLFRLAPRSEYSVWRPTAATEQIGLLLAGVALALLLRRALQLAATLSWLGRLRCLAAEDNGHQGERAEGALRRAAASLRLPARASLPALVLTELPAATPLLLGLRRPYLLLAPSLAALLSDDELEMALRHELAHLQRRDHWWRWLLLWVGDLSGPNPLAPWLSREAMEQEESFCDRLAVASARDASHLAQAIIKSRLHLQGGPPGAPPLPAKVLPMLVGLSWGSPSPEAVLRGRLARLVALARELSPDAVPGTRSPGASPPAPRPPQSDVLRRGLHWAAYLALIALLALVVYAKYFLVVNFS